MAIAHMLGLDKEELVARSGVVGYVKKCQVRVFCSLLPHSSCWKPVLFMLFLCSSQPHFVDPALSRAFTLLQIFCTMHHIL